MPSEKKSKKSPSSEESVIQTNTGDIDTDEVRDIAGDAAANEGPAAADSSDEEGSEREIDSPSESFSGPGGINELDRGCIPLLSIRTEGEGYTDSDTIDQIGQIFSGAKDGENGITVIGSGEDVERDGEYSIALTPQGEMVVISKASGRALKVTWDDVVSIAVYRGIDLNEDGTPAKASDAREPSEDSSREIESEQLANN